jgi:hypothetical protein
MVGCITGSSIPAFGQPGLIRMTISADSSIAVMVLHMAQEEALVQHGTGSTAYIVLCARTGASTSDQMHSDTLG